MASSPQIDWFHLIMELQRAGWTYKLIGRRVRRSRNWVLNLKNIPGTEPRFHDGMLLVALWHEVFGKGHPIPGLKGQEPDHWHTDTAPVPASGKDHPHAKESPAASDTRCPAGCRLCPG